MFNRANPLLYVCRIVDLSFPILHFEQKIGPNKVKIQIKIIAGNDSSKLRQHQNLWEI